MLREQRARAAVDKIIDTDLTDRRGLKQEWYQIDAETQEEIRETWKKIIVEFMA